MLNASTCIMSVHTHVNVYTYSVKMVYFRYKYLQQNYIYCKVIRLKLFTLVSIVNKLGR